MAASTRLAATCLFSVLGCFVSATVIYTTVTDGLPFRKQLLTPWMAATLVDFYINVFAIAAWVFYKENCWIRNLVWLVLLVCLGSITTCVYVTWQLLKLSPQEAAQDPIYHVLLRNDHKPCFALPNVVSVPLTSEAAYSLDVKDRKAACFSASISRIIFGILGCLMLGTLTYTILTDGSPFRKELLTPWLTATLIDFYTNVIAISVWVAYKESNWTSAFIWILILICTGSLGTCMYMVSQLFHLSPQDPVYLVLINSRNRAGSRYEEALQG